MSQYQIFFVSLHRIREISGRAVPPHGEGLTTRQDANQV